MTFPNLWFENVTKSAKNALLFGKMIEVGLGVTGLTFRCSERHFTVCELREGLFFQAALCG